MLIVITGWSLVIKICYELVKIWIMRNWLKKGDKVLLKDGKIVTVKGLEISCIITEELNSYVSKLDVVKILNDL